MAHSRWDIADAQLNRIMGGHRRQPSAENWPITHPGASDHLYDCWRDLDISDATHCRVDGNRKV